MQDDNCDALDVQSRGALVLAGFGKDRASGEPAGHYGDAVDGLPEIHFLRGVWLSLSPPAPVILPLLPDLDLCRGAGVWQGGGSGFGA